MTMDRHVNADTLEAYVLDQLAEHEVRDVEMHLRECTTCARDVHELHVVLSGIGESVPPVPTSTALRARVLAAVAQEAQEPIHVARQSGVVARSRPPAWSLVSLAAAAVLILAVGAMAIRSERSRQELADNLTRVQAINDDLRKRVERYGGQTDLALSILTSGDMREIAMTGSDAAANAAARAYWSPTRGLLVVADRLPAPPPGRIYQVWIIEKGTSKPLSAGLLGDEPGGRGMLIVTPPRPDASSSVTVAVTDEPPGGSAGPSSPIRLAGSI